MVEKSSYYTVVDRLLNKEEHLALKAFNGQVSYYAFTKKFPDARIMAVGNLDERTTTDLAKAFRALYPHWFTNGRGSAIECGQPAKCQQVCLEVVGKLNKFSGKKFDDILRLFDLSGNNAMITGRRPLAHTDPSEGYRRTRTRMRRTHCKFHQDKVVVARDLCARCYNRMNTLQNYEIFVELLPKAAMKEIMELPRPTKRKPLYVQAGEIVRKYEAMEKEAL